MRSNLLGAFLAGALVVGAVGASWLAAVHFFAIKELEKVTARYVTVTTTVNAVQALANEAVDYSKRNAAIDPILQQYELKPKPGASVGPGQPAPKPAAR